MSIKIGVFCDSFSLYNNKYPLSRNSHPLFKKMNEEGYDNYLLYPEASETVMKRYRGEYNGEKLNDVLKLLKPVTADNKPDIDILFVNYLPWSNTNWRNRDYINNLLLEYGKKAKLIIWRTTDAEKHCDKKVESYLKDWLPKNAKWFLDKTKVIYSTYSEDFPEIFHGKWDYCSAFYDSELEIPIKPKTEREYGVIFGGPIGYRVTMGNLLRDHILPVLEDNNIKSKFYGEDFFKKYTIKNGFDGIKELGKFNNVEFIDGRIFLSDREYFELLSNSLFSLHDSILVPWGVTDVGVYSTGRTMEAAQSGTWLLSTPFYHMINNKRIIIENQNHIVNDKNVRDIVNKVINMSDDEYENHIINLRHFMRENFDVSIFMDKLNDLIRKNI